MGRKLVHRIIQDQKIPIQFYQFCHKRVSFLLEPIMVDEKSLHFLLANAYYQGSADAIDAEGKLCAHK
jgi:hypothetical protein